MYIKEFVNPLTLEEALKKISENESQGYRWYPVKTECGNLLEVGGREKELKVSILKLNNDGSLAISNDCTKDICSISVWPDDFMRLDVSDATCIFNKFKTRKDLIKYLNTKNDLNRKQVRKKRVYRTVFDHWELSL